MTNKDATLEGRAPILVEKFVQLYGAEPLVVQAPGRVNLIGEHTDYNEGFVFPAAINFQTRVAIAPRVDRRLVVTSENYSERVELDLERLPAMSRGHWSDYVVGVARLVRDSVPLLPWKWRCAAHCWKVPARKWKEQRWHCCASERKTNL